VILLLLLFLLLHLLPSVQENLAKNSEARTTKFLHLHGVVYTTLELPKEARNVGASETKKYRDYVCEIFNLHFKQIAGAGNCFFESVATLLPLVPGRGGQVYHHHTLLRSVAIKWLRDCATRTGLVYEECMVHMRAELQHPIGKETPHLKIWQRVTASCTLRSVLRALPRV
jgi:hypothetical protein